MRIIKIENGVVERRVLISKRRKRGRGRIRKKIRIKIVEKDTFIKVGIIIRPCFKMDDKGSIISHLERLIL